MLRLLTGQLMLFPHPHPQAYSYLERRCDSARAECDLSRPQGCADLARLNDMTHELLATGSVRGDGCAPRSQGARS